MRSGGSRKPTVIVCAPAFIALPVRSRKGTPAQRQVSTWTRSATSVSTSERASTSSSSR